MIETKSWLNFYLTENPEVQQSNNMNMSINVDDIPQGKSQNKAKVVELLVAVSISTVLWDYHKPQSSELWNIMSLFLFWKATKSHPFSIIFCLYYNAWEP